MELGSQLPIDADEVATSIKAALEGMNMTDSVTGLNVSVIPEVDVAVQSYTPNAAGGFTWLVTFVAPENGGNVPQLHAGPTCDQLGQGQCDTTLSTAGSSSDVGIETGTVEEGNQLDGTFKLTFDGETTGEITFDASEAVLTTQLEALTTIESVTVSRSLPVNVSSDRVNEQKEFVWRITYTSNVHSGDS